MKLLAEQHARDLEQMILGMNKKNSFTIRLETVSQALAGKVTFQSFGRSDLEIRIWTEGLRVTWELSPKITGCVDEGELDEHLKTLEGLLQDGFQSYQGEERMLVNFNVIKLALGDIDAMLESLPA